VRQLLLRFLHLGLHLLNLLQHLVHVHGHVMPPVSGLFAAVRLRQIR
jgi:hypothetical protein